MSVIIATYERPHLLMRTVRSVRDVINQFNESSLGKAELIVVDQSSRPSETLMASADVTYLMESIPSLPRARNVGFARSRGQLVLFLDDDVVPSANLLVAHYYAHQEGPRIGVVGGRVVGSHVPPGNCTVPGAWVDWLGRSRYNQTEAEQARGLRGVIGCNMSFKREVLQQVGFDPGYTGTAVFEETDVCYRARALGWDIMYEPAAEIEHLVEPTGGTRTSSARALKSRYGNLVRFALRNLPIWWWPSALCAQGLVTLYKLVLGKRRGRLADAGR